MVLLQSVFDTKRLDTDFACNRDKFSFLASFKTAFVLVNLVLLDDAPSSDM